MQNSKYDIEPVHTDKENGSYNPTRSRRGHSTDPEEGRKVDTSRAYKISHHPTNPRIGASGNGPMPELRRRINNTTSSEVIANEKSADPEPTEENRRKKSKKKKKENITPVRGRVPVPNRRLFQDPEEDGLKLETIPVDTDLEVLLVNSCKIDAVKIQTIVEDFIRGRKYTTLFCLTETKVEGHDFQPDGIKIFSKQRRRKNEKKGGG